METKVVLREVAGLGHKNERVSNACRSMDR